MSTPHAATPETLTLDELTPVAQAIEQQVNDWHHAQIAEHPEDKGKHAVHHAPRLTASLRIANGRPPPNRAPPRHSLVSLSMLI